MLKQVYARPERIPASLIDRYAALQRRPGNRHAARDLFRYALTLVDKEPEGLDRLTMPVLLLWGEQDHWIPIDYFRRWQQALPYAMAVSYPDAGHMPMEEISERSLQDMLAFLAACPVHSS